MAIIDAQVHVYERNHPGRPWTGALHGPKEMNGEQMLAAMAEAGVDAAVLVSAWSLYRDDASYALSVMQQYPGRFALVCPLNPADPDVAEKIAELARTPGGIAVRLIIMGPITAPGVNISFPMMDDPVTDPGVNRIFSTATKYSVPVNFTCVEGLDQAAALAKAHPNCRIVIDHMGLRQPFEPPVPPDVFRNLPQILALAKYDNVAMKLSGVCTLSREPYPFNDLWDPVGRVIDAFGIDRCMYGTDWTRALSMVSYKDSIDMFRKTDRLTATERDAFLGGNLQRIYNWSPTLT